ncbi:MAG: DNA-processing protein DprA [Tepidisphaeraceae bacterium]|jgi:DNA processing protein
MSQRHWLQLALTEGIGPILIGRLLQAAGGAEAACEADAKMLREIDGIGSAKSHTIRESLKRAAGEVDAELDRCQAAGARLICMDDPEYPELLKSISDPPPVLYIRGALEPRDLNAVGIVGSRRCSHYGREQAERFGALLAQAGITVISGGARGVDSAAHRGAMAPAAGRTIAVLGCGVDIAYPPENQHLFQQISQRGAVVSEFPMSTPPLKDNFPRRNRIISGMSRGVLVVEADIASGALITARLAGDEQGRPVFAVPGRVDNAMSAGPHALIRDGATLVTNLEEILDGLGPLPHSIMEPVKPVEQTLFEPKVTPSVLLSDRQQQVLTGIGLDPISVDGIIARCELPAEIVMQELTMMTLRGVVKRVDGHSFVRCGS